MGQGKWGPGSQMRVNCMLSLALREWDMEWVSFDERIMEEAQTGGAAQGGAGLAGAPPPVL